MGAVGRMRGLALVLGLVAASCGGSGGNNDNGVSFRAVGFFQGQLQGGRCQVPTASNAIADQSIDLPLDSAVLDSGYPAGIFFCRGFLWLENNLATEAVVVNSLDLEYEIPGARVGIPSNSVPIGARILPVPPATTDQSGGQTTQNPFGPQNVYIGQPEAQLIPASLVLFLRQNRQTLPQLPYAMVIHATAHGQTDAGDSLTSNEVNYTVTWNEDTLTTTSQ